MSPVPSPTGRVLTDDAIGVALTHHAAEHVLAGSPTTATTVLGSLGGLDVGIWEISEGSVRDIEVDEIFVVLSGSGRVDVDDGERIELRPGVTVRLRAGDRTVWTITERLRKLWLA